jgi:uncharacterized protein (DUF58 family)
MPYRQFQWSDLRLTRRGWSAIAVAALAVGCAWLFGERALNAVVVPVVVGLLAGVVQVALASDPTVERTPPVPGFPGESGTAGLSVSGGSTVVDVAESVPESLVVSGAERTVAPPTEFSYTVEYRPADDHVPARNARGVYEFGPTTVTLRDVFGLVRRTVTAGGTDEVVVYPQVHALAEAGALDSLLARSRTTDREEFDDVREYVPGDPLRDVHWKSSAKREDLIVKEFTGRKPDGSVEVAASIDHGEADLVAAATASVAVALLSAGLSVSLTLPDGRIEDAVGDEGRLAILSALASAESGRVDPDDWEQADATVTAADGTATVAVGSRTVEFDRLRDPAVTASAADGEVSA